MNINKIPLKEAIKFHGHLGPYLVLGLLSGEFALKALRAKKHFGIKVKVWGANKRPKSCLVDGLQLSTGATYGKGNIRKYGGKNIKMQFCNVSNGKAIVLKLKPEILETLDKTKTHQDAETLAKILHRKDPKHIFKLT